MTSALQYPTIFKSFTALAEKYPDKTAVVYLGTEFSYTKLHGLTERFAAGLASIGLKQNDRILMYIPNSIHFVIAWLGIQRLGAAAVPITPIYTPKDLNYIANDTGAKAVICSDRNYGYVKRSLAETSMERVIISSLIDLLPLWKQIFGRLADKVPTGKVEKSDFITLMRDLVSGGHPAAPKPTTGEDDVAEILYTGGTTKHPKGVPISQGFLLISSEEQLAVRDPLFPKDQDVILGGAPLFHVLGQTCSLSTVFVGGGTLLVSPRVNLDAVCDSIQRNRAKSVIGVPAFYRMILEHDRVDQYDLSSLKYCFSGGDVLPMEVSNRWKRRFGITIVQGYGATETCGGIVMCPTDRESPPQAMGLPVPSKHIKIVEPNGVAPVDIGQPGELIVSSDRMVRAYLNKPEETAQSFVEIEGRLWYRTSDIVKADEEGFIYFVDRTADTIKHKGYQGVSVGNRSHSSGTSRGDRVVCGGPA